MYPSVSTKTMRSYLLQTFALTILVGGVLGWIYFSVFPEHYFQGYPALPVFFFLLGAGTVGLMEKCQNLFGLILNFLQVNMGHQS